MGKIYFITEKTRSLGNSFFMKSVFTIFIGLLLWMVSTILFGGTVIFLFFDLTSIILLLIGYIALWVTTIILANQKKNRIAQILFFITAFYTGIMQSPVIIWGGIYLGDLQQAINLFLVASILGVLATGIALYVGYKFRERLNKFRDYWWLLAIYGLIVLIISIIIGFLYNFETYMLITSPLVLIWIFGTIIYDGIRLGDRNLEEEWMTIALSIFLDLIIVIIRIFYYLVRFSKRR